MFLLGKPKSTPKPKPKVRIPFKDWIRKEYLEFPTHPWNQLAWDINTKWLDFPENIDTSEETLLSLEQWLFNHGACSSCQANFKGAWRNYINDICC